jgi:hypothetical protein
VRTIDTREWPRDQRQGAGFVEFLHAKVS